MIADETADVKQSIKDVLRDNYFEIPRKMCHRRSISIDMKSFACS